MNKHWAKQQILDSYFVKTKEAEDYREKETEAAITIQKVVRGYRTRKQLENLREKALIIQKAYRRHLARKEYNSRLAEKCKKERMDVFNAAATKFQKVFRGWYIRKHVLDFYKRKAYLNNIESKNAEMEVLLDEHVQQQMLAAKEEAEMAHMNAVVTASKSLHHLVSTKTQPSIFASPYATQKPTICGEDVEQFIEKQTKDVVKTRMMTQRLSRTRAMASETMGRTDNMAKETQKRATLKDGSGRGRTIGGVEKMGTTSKTSQLSTRGRGRM